MASLKDLKKRISSVKNTQQTTKAMKMVSAAKLRRAQDAIMANRPYARKVDRLIRLVTGMSDTPITSPLIRGKAEGEPNAKPKVLLVPVTSDRGLCGGFNSNIIRKAERWINENKDRCEKIELLTVGKKGNEILSKRAKVREYREFGHKATFERAKAICNTAIEAYLSGDYDQVKFIYNEFKNAISQEVVVYDFLPIQEAPVGDKAQQPEEGLDLYVVKPSPEALLDHLLRKHFAIQVYRILLESQASEHGARMGAMDNATRNAGDMILALTLDYNKSRQASITKELLEIISGAESQKSQ